MVKEPANNYEVNNAKLLVEIDKSKEIQNQLPEDERELRVTECLTPELIRLLQLLVDRYSVKYNWRNYTWLEDMRAEAMLNLCKVALKFDRTKVKEGSFPNPFAYYTQIVSRVFLTYVEKERKQGRIKDDIIEMLDTELLPSFARQNEGDDISQNGVNLDGTKEVPNDPKKRRRRKKKPIKKKLMVVEDHITNMTDGEFQTWLDSKVSDYQAEKDMSDKEFKNWMKSRTDEVIKDREEEKNNEEGNE